MQNPFKNITGLVQQYLGNIQFPVHKQQIIDFAKNNNAPDMLVTLLDRLPDREYGSREDLNSAIEEVKKVL